MGSLRRNGGAGVARVHAKPSPALQLFEVLLRFFKNHNICLLLLLQLQLLLLLIIFLLLQKQLVRCDGMVELNRWVRCDGMVELNRWVRCDGMVELKVQRA